MRNPSIKEVLKALHNFGGRGGREVWTGYVSDELWRTGFHGVRRTLIKRRLTQAQAQGLVTRSEYPTATYGYMWTITDDGIALIG